MNLALTCLNNIYLVGNVDFNEISMHMDQPNIMNVENMKLRQRLVVLEEQVQQHSADSITLQQQLQPLPVMPIVHTDSGLRLNGDVLEDSYETEKVPPGYTAN